MPALQINTSNKANNITSRDFGKLIDGRQATLYTLTNKNGCQVSITNYGGIIVSLVTPDAYGKFDDIVLGYDTIEAYQNDPFYLGAIIGRYANRIEKGQFSLVNHDNGELEYYQLPINNNGNHLHGGQHGFSQKLWQAHTIQNHGSSTLSLKTSSHDGEEGYPGKLSLTVDYTFTDDNELLIEYYASTTRPTIINLTQHSYFNLAGQNNCNAATMLNHQLMINAEFYLPVNKSNIPTQQINSVVSSPFDFLKAKAIAQDIDASNEQIGYGHGYDHFWLFSQETRHDFTLAAQVVEPVLGRRLSLYTDQPGMQFYSGNFLDASQRGKNNNFYEKRSGFCLESQHAANAPNAPSFSSTRLEPSKPFYSKTVFTFDHIDQ